VDQRQLSPVSILMNSNTKDGADERAPLLSGLRRGDDEAFATLVHEHARRLLATARRLLRSEDDARDAVQQAFVSAARAIGSFAGGSKLSTWLHRIVIKCGVDEAPQPAAPGGGADRRSSATLRFRRASSRRARRVGETRTDVLLERSETRAAVRRCIDRLLEQYRTVLILRDIEDLDTQETAERLTVTRNIVKIRLHRARQMLRALLERDLVRHPSPGRASGQ